MPEQRFIIVFDGQDGMIYPMGWSPECEGALECLSDSVALLPSRAAARRSIRISTAWAKLQAAQGKPANEDFLSAIRCIRILPCKEGTSA